MVRYALAGDMLGELSRNWWVVVLRGITAVVFGLIALLWPGLTLVALAVVFGVFAIVDGGALGFAAFRATPGTRAALVGQAVLSVLLGLIAVLWPVIAVIALVFVIGLWAIITGVAEIVTAVRLRAHISSEWLLIFIGALSIVFGLLLWFWPLEGAQAIVLVVAIYAIIFGVVLAAAGFRLRGVAEAFALPGNRTRGVGPRPGGEPGDAGTGAGSDDADDTYGGGEGRHRASDGDNGFPEPPEAR